MIEKAKEFLVAMKLAESQIPLLESEKDALYKQIQDDKANDLSELSAKIKNLNETSSKLSLLDKKFLE